MRQFQSKIILSNRVSSNNKIHEDLNSHLSTVQLSKGLVCNLIILHPDNPLFYFFIVSTRGLV